MLRPLRPNRFAIVLSFLFGLALGIEPTAVAAKSTRSTKSTAGKKVRVATTTTARVRDAGGGHEHAGTTTVGEARRRIRLGIDLPGKVVGHLADPRKSLPLRARGKYVIAFASGADDETGRRVGRRMRAAGDEVARQGHVASSGACKGGPNEAIEGANAAGGVTMGISSHASLEDHIVAGEPTQFTVLQNTKLPPSQRGQKRPNYMGREINLIERADIVYIAAGRFGTLGELALALEERRVVGVLVQTGGMADLVKAIVAASTKAGKPPGAPVLYDTDERRLIRRLIAAKQKFDAAGGKSGPIGVELGS